MRGVLLKVLENAVLIAEESVPIAVVDVQVNIGGVEGSRCISPGEDVLHRPEGVVRLGGDIYPDFSAGTVVYHDKSRGLGHMGGQIEPKAEGKGLYGSVYRYIHCLFDSLSAQDRELLRDRKANAGGRQYRGDTVFQPAGSGPAVRGGGSFPSGQWWWAD